MSSIPKKVSVKKKGEKHANTFYNFFVRACCNFLNFFFNPSCSNFKRVQESITGTKKVPFMMMKKSVHKISLLVPAKIISLFVLLMALALTY